MSNSFGNPTKTLALLLALGAAACGESDPFGVHGGGVRFVLTSTADAIAPSVDAVEPGVVTTESVDASGPMASGDFEGDRHHNPFFESANVTFTSILARDLDGVLVDVVMELPTTVDIVSMEDGRQVTLPDGELPPATYDQVVVVMSEVQGVTYDGTTITIAPPGGGWTAIVPICPFVVEEGATTVVGLALEVGRSFAWRDNRFHFQPRFVCEQAEDGMEG